MKKLLFALMLGIACISAGCDNSSSTLLPPVSESGLSGGASSPGDMEKFFGTGPEGNQSVSNIVAMKSTGKNYVVGDPSKTMKDVKFAVDSILDAPSEAARDIDTDAVEEYYSRGINYWNAGRVAEAEQQFILALDKDPDHLLSRNGLAYMLLVKGYVFKAAGHYWRVLQSDPPTNLEIDARMGLGTIFFKYGLRRQQEESDPIRYMWTHGRDPEELRKLRKSDEYFEDAMEQFDTVEMLQTDLTRVLFLKATLLQGWGKYAEAVKMYYSYIIKLNELRDRIENPRMFTAYEIGKGFFGIAMAYEGLKSYMNAREYYEKTIKVLSGRIATGSRDERELQREAWARGVEVRDKAANLIESELDDILPDEEEKKEDE